MRFLGFINALALAALLALLPENARAETEAQQLQRWQKECDAKDWQSCVVLGYHYLEGEGVPKDPVKGGALQERACNAGYGGGCVSLAFLWEDGALGNDLAKVIRLRNRGCELKDGGGCHHLGQMYLKGLGVKKDVARALKLYELGCDLGEGDACIELETMYRSGDEVPKDEKRADAYYERGCDLQAMLCIMVFNSYLNVLVESCDEGKAAVCNEVGNIHLDGESYLKPDEAEAAKYFQKACDLNFGPGCGLLGWLHEFGKQTPKDLRKAGPYYQKSCASGQYAYGCMMLGLHQLDGSGVTKDERRAAESLRTACNTNKTDVSDACWVLADMYRQGTGVAQDPARAMTLYAQACRLGRKEACAAPAQAAAKPAASGCSVVKVQLGADTLTSVQSDIKRRGGSAFGGTNSNGKPVLNAMSGDYQDVGAAVMNVGYTFDAEGPAARLIGVMIVIHANSSAEFEKLRIARQAASAAVARTGGPTCATRLVPNANTWFIHEFYELKR